MARRHLGYGVEEWRVLPWWQTRMYAEGLVWEFSGEDVDPALPPDDLAGLATLGLSVRKEVV